MPEVRLFRTVAQPAHPFAHCFTALRVSRGVSALGRAMSFELGPSRSAALASAPDHSGTDERDQRCVRSVPASHHSFDEHSYLFRFRVIVTDSSSGVYQDGMPPTWTGDLHASRRAWSLRRVVAESSWGRVTPRARTSRATTPRDRASDTPVAAFARYRAHISRVRGPIRRDRQDRFGPLLREKGATFPGPGCLPSTESALLLFHPLEWRLRVL